MTPNPWLRSRRRGVVVWAHRGGAHEAPSNTIYAMRKAVERIRAAGVEPALELDLRPTADLATDSADGVVVFHDATLEKVTNLRGPIADRPYNEIARADVAHWWRPGSVFDHTDDGRPFPLRGRADIDDLRIPRLVDVLEAFPDVPISLDLKAPGMADVVARLLEQFGRIDDVFVAAFSEKRVKLFRRATARVPTGPGVRGCMAFFVCSRLGIAFNPWQHAVMTPPVRLGPLTIDRRLVEWLHSNQIAINVWTVNDMETLDHLLDVGVDGVITDIPTEVSKRVAEFNSGQHDNGW